MQGPESDGRGADWPASLGPGLSAAEVADRAARGDVNRPPRSHWSEYRDLAVRNVATLFNALVVPAAAALFVLGDYNAAWAVSAMALINTVVALIQEVRAKQHLDELTLLTEPRARVRREGAEEVIPAGDVVLGDCLLLGPGEAVVADGSVTAARFLEVDEALLTGESDPVPRQVGERLLSGSFCVAGEGAYQAERVGAESLAYQTALAARRYQAAPSPMQRILDTIIRVLTALALVLCAVYVGLHYARGFPLDDLWRMIAATVTSLIPQGLVLMTTLTFTLAAVRMSKRGASVQRLNAVEAMASVDVLCLDKTGTLTTGKLRLSQLEVLDRDDEAVRALLRLFAWASIDAGNKSIQALRSALGELTPSTPPELLDQVPFKSQNRYSAVRVRTADGERALFIGAFEALRPRLVRGAEQAEEAWQTLLPSGQRLLLFAEAAAAGPLESVALRPLALVGLTDELRPSASAILAALSAQNITFKILSGDNPETVRATVAAVLPELVHDKVISGAELDTVPNLARLIEEHHVFGRISPKQKVDIIRILQAGRHQVGMIGDGVNDVLALKRADLGIAMGAGSRAAKTVAALVLENDDFALLPVVLEEGRIILENLRRSAKLFLLKNAYSILLILLAFGLLGLGFPYLPQQVTLLNALTIGGPAFVIMLGRPHVRAGGPAFLPEVLRFVLFSGTALAAAALVLWVLADRVDTDADWQRTLVLTTLVLGGLANVLLLAQGDKRLHAWAALALPIYAALMYLSWTARFFVLTPLSVPAWLAAGGAAICAYALAHLSMRGASK